MDSTSKAIQTIGGYSVLAIACAVNRFENRNFPKTSDTTVDKKDNSEVLRFKTELLESKAEPRSNSKLNNSKAQTQPSTIQNSKFKIPNSSGVAAGFSFHVKPKEQRI